MVNTVDGAVSVVRMRAVDTVDSNVLVILIRLASASSLLVGDWDASAPVVLWVMMVTLMFVVVVAVVIKL